MPTHTRFSDKTNCPVIVRSHRPITTTCELGGTPTTSQLALCLSSWSSQNKNGYTTFLPPDIVRSITERVIQENRKSFLSQQNTRTLRDADYVCTMSGEHLNSWKWSQRHRNMLRRRLNDNILLKYHSGPVH